MSETIDSKVVEMRFDNKDFEANTRTTMSTLDKLKAKLHFPGASKGLEEIGQTAKRVDFSGMSSGIQTVQMKFSALQVMGITALQNITNAAISADKQLTDAITIDPVKDGFAEYETQMNSVQTILANTQKEGTNVQTVNKALDELNTYADKTIYNFTEMTRNIGTFTAAGVKLDASVSAIKGIANLAAVSGSNSQQASTAMYQLSQALAAGKVQLMDWNSVVNAGMGGQVFQDALIRTSEHLQTGAKAAIEAKGSFRESLQDEWLTTEVLTQTLDQFATAADTQEEYNAAVKKFVDQGYTQEQAKEMADMAKTAGDAATKVKTFSQLIDTLKEALGSGWTKTWQLIIGDFDEAKEVWTKVSDVLGGFINKASDARNAIVEAAMGNPYSNLAKNIQKVTSATSDYKDIVDSVIKGDYGNGQPRFDKLTAEGHDWARVQNLVNERLGCSFRYTEELTTSQEDLNKEQAKTIDQILKMSDAELTKNGLTKEDVKALKELQKQSEKTGIPINDLINDMDKLSGKELLHGSVANMGNALINLFTEIHNAWQKVFDPVSAMTLYNIIASMHGVTSKFLKFTKDNGDELTRTLAGVFAALDIIRQCLGGSLKFSIKAINAVLSVFGMNTLDLTADLGDLLVKFDKWLKKTDPFTQGFTKVGEGIKFVVEQFDKFVAFLNTIPEFQAFTAELNSFKESIKGLSFEDIQKNFEKFVSYIESILPKSMKNVGKNVISGFKNGLSSGKTEIPKILADIGIRLLKAIKKVLGIHSPSKEMEAVGENTLSGLWNGLISGRIKIVDFFKTLGSDMLNGLQSIDWDNVVAGGIGVGLVWGLKKLYDIADKALSPAEGIGKVLSGVGEVVEKSADKIPKILNNASKVVKSFSKVLKAKAFKTRMEGVKDLAISIAILAGSLWVLSTINTDALHNAEEAMLILGGTLAVMTWVMDKLSSASASVGKDGIQVNGLKTGLAGLGIAVLLIAESVKILGKLNEDEINQGMECAGLLLLGITGILFMYGELVKGEAAKNIDKAGKMISKIGKTMLLIVGVIKLFSMLSVGEVENGLNFAGVFLGFVIAYLAISNLAGDKIDSVGKMVKSIVVSMGLMVGVVKLVSKLEPALQVENALPNALALSTLLLSLSVSMAIIGKVGTISAKALISVGVMTLVVAALAGILYLIRDLNPESSIGNAEALSMLLLSLSASCGILAAVGLAGTAGFAGIGVLAALIAAVGAIVVAIGALFEKVPALEGFLDKGIPILQKIGYALGSFLGNIVGGFTEGATSGLPGVGKNLSDFMKNAQPFIEGAKGIDSSVTTGITSLCKAILALTGTDLLNAIASFITGGASFVKMGEQLKPFGEALSDYAQSVKGINAEDIQASAKAAKALVALNDALPKSGGFLGKLLGNSDLANLGTQLKPFGEALSDYSNSVANVSPDKVAFATSAVKSLVEAINATDSVKATGTSTFVQAVDTLAETNISGFVSAFKGSSSKVRNVGSMLTSALAGGVKSKSNTLSATASNMAESMKNSIASKDKEFQKVGVALISALAIGIQAQVNQAVNAANYVGASAANGSGQAYTSFYMNGINLGRGLVLGMNAMQQSAYNSGYALGQAAVRGEKDGQKSHSPSKLTIQAGKWLGEGLIIGMNAMESKTYGAGKSMGETAFDSIRSALSGMNDIIDSDMDTTPTIRPVLDLTNVKATAGKLNGLFTDPAFTPLANLRAIGNISARNNQNGNSDEVVRAINRLGKSLNNVGNTYNSINGVTYDNGSEISNAVETLVRAATVGRRR